MSELQAFLKELRDTTAQSIKGEDKENIPANIAIAKFSEYWFALSTSKMVSSKIRKIVYKST